MEMENFFDSIMQDLFETQEEQKQQACDSLRGGGLLFGLRGGGCHGVGVEVR